MNKIIRVGHGPRGNVFCSIKFENDRLSITGVEGPRRRGDCRGGCGQIIMDEWEIEEYAPGFDAEVEAEFRRVWKRWHLNDMRAGTPAQEEWLRRNPVDRLNHYENACKALEQAGLNPDNGYRYGTKWLFEKVPDEVIAWLEGLPVSDLTPAWV